jgi:hypothetical protein
MRRTDFMRVAAVAILLVLGACGSPHPTEQISTDRFVGTQARLFGTPQAPNQEVYCYRTRGVAECATRPIGGQEYRIINYFDGTGPTPRRGWIQGVIDPYGPSQPSQPQAAPQTSDAQPAPASNSVVWQAPPVQSEPLPPPTSLRGNGR